MIPFDLTKAKKGIPMRTRFGHEARLITHLNGGQPAPLLVEVMKNEVHTDGMNIPGTTSLENYYLNGKHGIVDSPLDLFMEY